MDNKSNILACALDLFASRGYEAVGVQEIVEAAGITKPTLYHYFGSKQGLLKALLEQHFAELHDVVQQAGDYQGDLPLTLRRLAGEWLQFAEKNPVFYRLALALLFTPPHSDSHTVAAALHQRQYDVVNDVFRKAVKEAGNIRGRETLYAATFVGQVNSIIFLWLDGHLELNEPLIERTVHQFEHGIYS